MNRSAMSIQIDGAAAHASDAAMIAGEPDQQRPAPSERVAQRAR